MNNPPPYPSSPLGYLRQHWPEYLMEATELGAFMLLLCTVVVSVQHPASPIHQAITNPLLRLALCGMLTAAWLYVRTRGLCNVRCAKLCHSSRHRCIFCEHQHRCESELNALNVSACAAPASLIELPPIRR